MATYIIRSGVSHPSTISPSKSTETPSHGDDAQPPGGLQSKKRKQNAQERIQSILHDTTFHTTPVTGKDGAVEHIFISPIFIPEACNDNHYSSLIYVEDHHHTFDVLSLGLPFAVEKTRAGIDVALATYIKDISDKRLIPALGEATKGANRTRLTLEMNKIDYGIMDDKTTKGLRDIGRLGVRHAVSDGILTNDGRLTFDTSMHLIHAGINPSYIKLEETVYNGLRKKTIAATSDVRDFFQAITRAKIKLLIDNSNQKKPTPRPVDNTPLLFLDTASVIKEAILTLDGRKYADELLTRFGDGVSVPDGLDILKEGDRTRDLMMKVAACAVGPVFQDGGRVSINTYIKDLGDPDFRKNIDHIAGLIPKAKRKGLIFEVLEEAYGVINNQVIANLRWLQKEGYALSIDDLFLGDCTKSKSKDILETLLEHHIYPDYIKIDGRHIEDIRLGKATAKEINHIRQLIWQLSTLPNKPIFILEWIQDIEHALQMVDLFGKEGIEFLYQGRNIGNENKNPECPPYPFGVCLLKKIPKK